MPRYSPAQRAEAERRTRGTATPLAEIGRALGVPPRTLSLWSRQGGWRPAPGALPPGPAEWPPDRRAAVARLHREPCNDPGDIAAAMGLTPDGAAVLFRDWGLRRGRADPPAAPLDAAAAQDARSLRSALHGHVARQIAAFDAALQGQGAAVIDSARVLRDLGGLKRLLDDLAEKPEGGDGLGDGLGGDVPDLYALRAEIARRLGSPSGPAGPAGEPAGPDAPGAGA